MGNKIDAIPGDSKGWLKQAEQALRDALPSQANVLDVSFISAKTGYGIEELITKIYKIWELRGQFLFPLSYAKLFFCQRLIKYRHVGTLLEELQTLEFIIKL